MPELKISVLDVGHGDFSYAETPFGHRLVIDCGSGDVVPSDFLSKVSTLDELQISHPHEDHFTDIGGLAKKTIRSFRCPSLEGFSDDQIAWRTKDKKKIDILRNVQNSIAVNNLAVQVGNGFGHSVWSPQAAAIDYDDPNTASCVTILSYGSFRMLFGADLPTEGWNELLKQNTFVAAIKGTTVYKVAHHGRDVGYSDALFQKMGKPVLCVVSDKMIDSTNENTQCIEYYRQRTVGREFVWPDGTRKTRKVLTTRNDGSVHIWSDSAGQWGCRVNTSWI